MGYVIRYNISKEGSESLLKLISCHLPKNVDFPISKYLFSKHFEGYKGHLIPYFYCLNCAHYISSNNDLIVPDISSNCSTSFSKDETLKKGCYFIYLDIDHQLANLLGKYSSQIQNKGLKLDVSYIIKSNCYNDLLMDQDDISLTWNTDVVPVFESSGFPIWPLQVQVNELL